MRKEVITKAPAIFLEYFVCLGIFSKVHAMYGSRAILSAERSFDEATASTTEEALQKEKLQPTQAQQPAAQKDVREIVVARPYHWRGWSLLRARDCLYLWNKVVFLELPNASRGWFRFILDGRLTTLYSSGWPKRSFDTSKNRSDFFRGLQQARAMVKPRTKSQPLLSSPSTLRLVVGKWSLSCTKESELAIHNSDRRQQVTLLREDLLGFIFESTRGTRQLFTADMYLQPELLAGWAGQFAKPVRSAMEVPEQEAAPTTKAAKPPCKTAAPLGVFMRPQAMATRAKLSETMVHPARVTTTSKHLQPVAANPSRPPQQTTGNVSSVPSKPKSAAVV
ncbi:hypothetical protein HPB51_013621 [Rhipicephalus microplus]|uniref:Uncharacterized protein n=1 Tax=Rhipicephalus microplus TaxID=6941 RepID=A0A9J6EHP4_RHIMP|nr:hypothetical protein HPB51_013621 [Rhipicephalus microplus]